MNKIYACLIGEWVCLNDDPDCKIGSDDLYSLNEWLNNGSEIYSPLEREGENSFLYQDYVTIIYKGKTYDISPIFIQTMSE